MISIETFGELVQSLGGDREKAAQQVVEETFQELQPVIVALCAEFPWIRNVHLLVAQYYADNAADQVHWKLTARPDPTILWNDVCLDILAERKAIGELRTMNEWAQWHDESEEEVYGPSVEALDPWNYSHQFDARNALQVIAFGPHVEPAQVKIRDRYVWHGMTTAVTAFAAWAPDGGDQEADWLTNYGPVARFSHTGKVTHRYEPPRPWMFAQETGWERRLRK